MMFVLLLKYFSVGICGCGWHTAEAEISSAYRAFSNEKFNGQIGIYIGLTHVNVTMDSMPILNNNISMDIAFNERFGFDKPDQLEEEFKPKNACWMRWQSYEVR